MSSHGTAASGCPALAATAPRRPHNQKLSDMGYAHGVLMVIAFAFLFPMGAVALRLVKGKMVARVHAYWQSVAYLVALTGFIIGMYIAAKGGHGILTSKNGHKQIGLLVMILMTLQPLLGIFHHMLFKKYQKSTVYGLIHRFLGRAALLMGAINIALGLQLGPPKDGRIVAYAVVTAFFFGAYIAITLREGPEMMNHLARKNASEVTSRGDSLDTLNTSNAMELEKRGGRDSTTA